MYDCECGTCKHQKEQITLALEDNFKPVLNAVKKALKTLHTKGNYHPKDLADTKEYIHLIDATNNVFNYALKQVDLSPTMLKHLQNDVYTFSAVKTHTQLLELSRELLTTEKQIKPFATFEHDVSKIVTAYNSHYLEAEYEFAVGGSQMADRWESFSDDERYLLQYRTANDDKVRDSHAVLHNITLPKDDPFWDKYFAPNGWRCRCLVVQLLRALHKTSDSKKAIELGEKATTAIDKNGKNKLEIFRFNPGKKKIIFPPDHPYNKVKGADFVKEEVRKGNIKPEASNLPAGISDYENKLGITVDRSFFNHIQPDTKFTTTNVGGQTGKGAYYLPSENTVKIPIDRRRKKSKWKAESVVYHEFGHAIDWQQNLKDNPLVKKLMDKYRKLYAKDSNKLFKDLAEKANDRGVQSYIKSDWNTMEQTGGFDDTLMSLNSNFGRGHTKAYFKIKGRSEAEFLAHAFENRFAGNSVFKELAPDLYEDSKKLIDELLKLK
ncbi:phage head morphogenesis protein [Wenyingzhuangia aestuarii]|uniref:phage head morphogenesis protein n=1 Tax=Wenyingzhuangia aestuarii TaxID=1647582 RepID=UPI00143BB5AA|nr:phage minor head protein [Wenyingzhuangia aestuarii]NJB83630.1 SPP1 gp7 family putative phage head morphogenesis protein [Wenyingzhuangia aestuarii]